MSAFAINDSVADSDVLNNSPLLSTTDHVAPVNIEVVNDDKEIVGENASTALATIDDSFCRQFNPAELAF